MTIITIITVIVTVYLIVGALGIIDFLFGSGGGRSSMAPSLFNMGWNLTTLAYYLYVGPFVGCLYLYNTVKERPVVAGAMAAAVAVAGLAYAFLG